MGGWGEGWQGLHMRVPVQGGCAGDDLQEAGPEDSDKVLLAPAILAHAHVALLPAVLFHNCGEDLGALLEGYQKRRMPAHHHM